MVFTKPFWEVLVRPVVLPFFLLALLDGAMTVFGTSKALGGSPLVSLTAGLIVGSGVMVTLLCTFDIWGTWHPVLRESTFMTWLLRGLWGVAFFYDWGTSAWGLYELVAHRYRLGQPDHFCNLPSLRPPALSYAVPRLSCLS